MPYRFIKRRDGAYSSRAALDTVAGMNTAPVLNAVSTLETLPPSETVPSLIGTGNPHGRSVITEQKRINLKERGLLLIVTPLFLQAVQTFTLSTLLSRAEQLSVLPVEHPVTPIKICLSVGLFLTTFLFVAGSAIFSRSIIRRVQVMQENIQRMKDGLPLLQPIPGADELSDLDAEIHELASLVQSRRPMQATQSSTASNASL